MKKIFICLSAVLFAGCLQADTFFSLAKVPSALNATLAPHQDIDLMLEENGSAGYAWKAFYDPRLCSVSIEHKRPEYATPDGAGGYAKIEIEPVSAASFSVTLNYVTNQQNAVPLKSMKVNVTVTGGVAAAASVHTVPSAPAPVVATAQQVPSAPAPVVATAQQVPSAPAPVAAAAQPVQPSVNSVQIPFLIDDQAFRFDSVPAVLQTNLFIGQDIDFDLEEKPGENIYWRVVKYDPSICRIEIDHDRGGFWKRPKAEIEIKALRRGTTTIEFAAGTGAAVKTLRCIVTVQ